MKVLMEIPADVIKKKQQAIARYAPRIQYAIPPLELLRNRSDETPWDPPFPDGVEVLVDGLFTRVKRLHSNQSTGIPPRLMTGREWGQEYDVVKIKIPDQIDNVTVAVKAPMTVKGRHHGGNHSSIGGHHRHKKRHRHHDEKVGSANDATDGNIFADEDYE